MVLGRGRCVCGSVYEFSMCVMISTQAFMGYEI
jgi:hypothetical protein